VKEVAAFCSEQNEWIVDIRRFTSSWSDAEADKWKGQPATAIEELLNLLKAWSEKARWLLIFIFDTFFAVAFIWQRLRVRIFLSQPLGNAV